MTLFFASILFGCKEIVDPPPVQQLAVTGIVRNLNGNPVPGAYLNFQYRLRSKFTQQTIEPSWDGPILITFYQVNVPMRTYVKFTVENYLHQLTQVIRQDTLDAGSYSFWWNGADTAGKSSYSDCYFLRAWVGDSLAMNWKNIINRRQHIAAMPLAFAQTDQQGRFVIPLTRLPLNEEFAYGMLGVNQPDSVRLDGIQYLMAFDSTHYGVDTISTTDLSEHTIVLATPKR